MTYTMAYYNSGRGNDRNIYNLSDEMWYMIIKTKYGLDVLHIVPHLSQKIF